MSVSSKLLKLVHCALGASSFVNACSAIFGNGKGHGFGGAGSALPRPLPCRFEWARARAAPARGDSPVSLMCDRLVAAKVLESKSGALNHALCTWRYLSFGSGRLLNTRAASGHAFLNIRDSSSSSGKGASSERSGARIDESFWDGLEDGDGWTIRATSDRR